MIGRLALVAALLAAALAALPAAARADDPTTCVTGADPSSVTELGRLTAIIAVPVPVPVIVVPGNPPTLAPNPAPTPAPVPAGGAAADAGTALGDQFVAAWLDPARQAWEVGLAPGALDAAAARTAIGQQIASRFAAADAQYLIDHLLVVAQPFSAGNLAATAGAANGALAAAGLHSDTRVACVDGAYRVYLDVYTDGSDAAAAQVAGLLAPFGDSVRFRAAFHFPEQSLAGSVQTTKGLGPDGPATVRLRSQWGTVSMRRTAGWDAHRGGPFYDASQPDVAHLPALPRLRVVAGERVVLPSLTLTGASVSLGSTAGVELKSWKLVHGRNRSITLPKWLPPRAILTLSGAWTDPGAVLNGSSTYTVSVAVAPTASVGAAARVRGTRARWSVRCPKDATERCSGTATLRAGKLVVARARFVRLAAGASRTLTAPVGPVALARLGAHPTTAVKATVVRADGHGTETTRTLRIARPHGA